MIMIFMASQMVPVLGATGTQVKCKYCKKKLFKNCYLHSDDTTNERVCE